MAKGYVQQDLLRYEKMVENALRGVVRDALRQVEENGLPGTHHFYITFQTSFDGVEVPEHLLSRYPDEMMIVLQYEFYNLEVNDEYFGVTLSFNNNRERVVVPFAAITIFADPSVNFALQFQTQALADSEEAPKRKEKTTAKSRKAPPSEASAEAESPVGEVVSLDSFRKK